MEKFEDMWTRMLFLEFSETVLKKLVLKFSNESDETTIRNYLAEFEKFKNVFAVKDPFQYDSFLKLTEVVDAAKEKRNIRKGTKAEEFDTSEAIADDENVTIYKGDSQHKCVKYGKGYSFCISRPAGGNMYGSYRLGKSSSFYFVFFKNKQPKDPSHIMVLDRTKDGWEWTFADNDTRQVSGGWKEIVQRFPELAPHENLFQNIPMTEKEIRQTKELQRFSKNNFDNLFQKMDRETKLLAVKSGGRLKDKTFDSLDKHMRNEYFSSGPNLTPHQMDTMTPSEIQRYVKARAISMPQLAIRDMLIPSKFDMILPGFPPSKNGVVKFSTDNQTFRYKIRKSDGKIIGYEPSSRHRWLREYDGRGNQIHYKDSDGYEWWAEYDERGNMIHSKNSIGAKWWAEYDEMDNMTHYKDSHEHEWWKEYDENGNTIHSKGSDGYEWWAEYDERGNMIHRKDSDGNEWRREYDENGNMIRRN